MKTIKIKGEIYEACEAFPTIFEFKDEEDNDYYFRYRSSILTLTKNDELIFTFHVSDDFGGYMTWAECCLFYYSQERVFVDDREVGGENQWLNSKYMNELFKIVKEMKDE